MHILLITLAHATSVDLPRDAPEAGGPAAAADIIVVGTVGERTHHRDPLPRFTDEHPPVTELDHVLAALPEGVIYRRTMRFPVMVAETIKGPDVSEVYVRNGIGNDTLVVNVGDYVLMFLHENPEHVGDYYFNNLPGEVIVRASPIGCEPVAMVDRELLLLSYPSDPDKTALIGPVNNEEWTRINGVMQKSITDDEVCAGLNWDDLLVSVRAATATLEAR